MKYKVLIDFTDLKDDGFVYRAGDEYPREGKRPTKTRIKELASPLNKRGEPLIEAIEEEIVKAEPETEPEVEAEETTEVAEAEEEPKKSRKKEK